MFSIEVDKEITLRIPNLKHAEELFILIEYNRSYLRKYLPWVDQNLALTDSINFIKNSRKNFKRELGLSLCIFYCNKIVGTIGLHYIDKDDRKTEIGYWLAKGEQKKGIMYRSCQALIRYCFKTLKLHRIEIRCTMTNLASQRIPERLNFTKEGMLRDAVKLNRRFHDIFIYSLLSTD